MNCSATQKFYREKNNDGKSSLYTSIRVVNQCVNTINNEKLRSLTADHIFKHEVLHNDLAKLNSDCTTKQYCEKITKGQVFPSDIELCALTIILKLAIHQISFKTTVEGRVMSKVICYNTHAESFQDCVYLLYDEDNQQYEALYATHLNNSNDKQTIFPHNDDNIFQLAYKFIVEELKDESFVLTGDLFTCQHLNVTNYDDKSVEEPDVIPEMVKLNAIDKLSLKRKMPIDCEIMFATVVNVHNDLQPSNKSFETYTNITSSLDENLDDLSNFEKTQIFRFKNEPIESVRGRTSGDFEPKKVLKRDGTKSEIRSPRYFYDNNEGYFPKFQISKSCLSFDLFQYCIEIRIVTDEINGYTYYHPYFQFGIFENNNQQIRYVDRIRIDLSDKTKLTKIDEDLFELEHKIVVIMKKRDQLKECQQPLNVCSKSDIDAGEQPITETFKDAKDLINAYHLDKLRFVAILMTNLGIGNEYYPYKQCISQKSIITN